MFLPTVVIAGSPLFDAQIKARRTDAGIQVVVLIANRSRHRACYPVVTPNVTTKDRDGVSGVMISTNEQSWEYGRPPAFPIQFVPADGSTRAYPWILLPPESSAADAGKTISVKTDVVLYDCKTLFSANSSTYKEVFHATVDGPVEP